MAISIGTPGLEGSVAITSEEQKLKNLAQQSLTVDGSYLAVAKPITKSNADFGLNGTSSEEPVPLQVAQQDQVEDVVENDSSESVSDLENRSMLEHPTLSERRRIQNLKFNSLVYQRAETVTKDEVKAAVQSAADEELSIRSLMSRQESSRIISDPREYQMELFDKAKKQNTIAVLDTGSGKTLIAVLLLRYIIDQELADRSMGNMPRISFFLVDCVTLVFQQAAVLESNLDEKVERFCGEMKCDLWSEKTWDKHFKENMVIVCTAEILNQCLMHSFITMSQINLLIFDEAHHAKKNHAYARIIKDYYITQTDSTKRPKIFGMTASPVDAREDVIKAARELEVILHCQIATTSDLSLVRMSISRPDESIAAYPPLCSPYETLLYDELKNRFKDIEALSKLFKFAKEATSELGEWCADHVWSLALADEESLKVERKVERLFLTAKENRPINFLDAELSRLREAKEFVNKWTFPAPNFNGNSLSPKVLLLKNYLDLVFEKPSNARCIIFVKRRYTARLLSLLLAQIGICNLRLGSLVGTRYGDPGDVKISFRQQVLTLNRFRKGEINCLLATSIAEEGLDIPDCNLVIRFDLYNTLIQYIQSRGRARHLKSKYVHMIESGNKVHLQAISDVREGENVMRKFCEALPADRLLQGNDCDLDTALKKERYLRKYVDPGTGATLTYNSSLVVLSHFLGCLPHHNGASMQPNFVMTTEHKQYVCEVILPEKSPILSAVGRPSSRKSIAKRSAAFEACLLLRKGGHLDGNLISTYHKQLPAMRNAHLALNMKKSDSYVMKVKPCIWEKTRGTEPKELYMTVLQLETPENLGRSSQPLALLTRTPMPDFPPILLHLQPNKSSQVICTSIPKSIKLTEIILRKLNVFTLRIYKDIYNKKFEENVADMSYWISPIIDRPDLDERDVLPESLIDWSVLQEVYGNLELGWDMSKPHSYLANRYLVDKWDGGRRFFSVAVVPEMRPQDPVPADAAVHKYMTSILDYSVTLFKKSREKAKWNPDQPVILAHRVLHRLNWLDNLTEKEKEGRTISYVCPEPLLISALPVSVASMGYLFSAIVSRIESYLIALEACDLLGLKVHPLLALEAVTKDSDNTEEHREKQIHVQRGMGKNYERLEFIGDCFLKMATSISLYSRNPDHNEYEYHVRRMLLICNKNLFNAAVQKELYQYIRSIGFSRRNWYPQGIKLLEGKGHKRTGLEVQKHMLGDKTIADVCEALIGAALLSYRDTGNMDMAVKAVTVLVSNTDHDVSEWADYYRSYTKPPYQLAQASAAELALAKKVEQEHDYQFKYPRLCYSAFVHPSCPPSWHNKIPCYQRLEFLGDALLDMASINFLFHRHPDQDPQWLTEHKMAMVSNKFLAALCVKLGFNRHIRIGGALVEFQNREYATEIQEAEAESNGSPDYWTTTKTPPKCLSDIVEAYIGAIFVDSEFNFKEVERFFETHIRYYFEDMSIYDTFANNHPTTYLNNRLTNYFGCTNYRIMAREMPSISPASAGMAAPVIAAVMIHNEIIADASASSGKNAKVKASEKANKILENMIPVVFRKQFGCDCEGKLDEGVDVEMVIGKEIGSAI